MVSSDDLECQTRDVLTPSLPFALLFYENRLGIVDSKLEKD